MSLIMQESVKTVRGDRHKKEKMEFKLSLSCKENQQVLSTSVAHSVCIPSILEHLYSFLFPEDGPEAKSEECSYSKTTRILTTTSRMSPVMLFLEEMMMFLGCFGTKMMHTLKHVTASSGSLCL